MEHKDNICEKNNRKMNYKKLYKIKCGELDKKNKEIEEFKQKLISNFCRVTSQ